MLAARQWWRLICQQDNLFMLGDVCLLPREAAHIQGQIVHWREVRHRYTSRTGILSKMPGHTGNKGRRIRFERGARSSPAISPSVSPPLGARPEESGGSKPENPAWTVDDDDDEVSGMRWDEARDGDKESDDAWTGRDEGEGEGENEVIFRSFLDSMIRNQVLLPPKLPTHHRAQQGEGMTGVHIGHATSKDTSVVIRPPHGGSSLMSHPCGFLGQDIMERIHCLEADWLTSHMSLRSLDQEPGPKRCVESPADHNQQPKTLNPQDSILGPSRSQSTANALETSEWDLTASLSNTGDPMVQPVWSLTQWKGVG